MKTYTQEQLVAAGGKLWEKKGIRRIYFNGLADRVGLSVTRYGTGNVSSASLNGEGISNSKARAILIALEFGKVWYDLNTDKFETKGLDEWTEAIVASIITDIETFNLRKL
jgi:hypothetical protein